MEIREANLFFLFIIVLLILAQIFLPSVLFYLHVSSNLWTFYLEVFVLLVPSIIYIIMRKKSIKETLRLNAISLKSIGIIFLIALLSQPLMMFLSVFSQLFFHNYVADSFKQMSSLSFFVLLALIAVTPAICEETVMRGVILSGYRNVDIKKAALMNGLFFGLFHLGPQQFLYAFALGVVFVYIVEATNSIFASMLCHFFINGFSVTVSWITAQVSSNSNQQAGEFSAQHPSEIVGTLTLLLFLALLFTILLVMVIKELDRVNGDRLMEKIKLRNISTNENAESTVMSWHVYTVIGLYIIFLTIVQLFS